MLEKVIMQRTQQFSAFFVVTKKKQQFGACLLSQNFAIECEIAFSDILLFLVKHSLEFCKMWHEKCKMQL